MDPAQYNSNNNKQTEPSNIVQTWSDGPWNAIGRSVNRQQNSGQTASNNYHDSDSFLGQKVVDLERAVNHLLQLQMMSKPMYCPPIPPIPGM